MQSITFILGKKRQRGKEELTLWMTHYIHILTWTTLGFASGTQILCFSHVVPFPGDALTSPPLVGW